MKGKKAKTSYSKIIALLTIISMLSCVVYPMQIRAEEAEIETISISAKYGQTEARSIYQMTNEFRTGNNAWVWESDNTTKTTYTDLNALVYDYDLEQTAMKRAAEIAVYYSHTRPNGTGCFTAYPSGYQLKGENIVAGYRTAEAVFEGWKEESENYEGQGHRRNMLDSGFNAVGIGHVYYNGYHYWVQEFGKTSKSTNMAAANDSETEMEVDVLKSEITKTQVVATESNCIVKCGQTVNVPSYQVKINLTETWPGGMIPVNKDAEWNVENTAYVRYSNGTLTGIKEGSTRLKSNVDEGAIIDVTVDHAWDSGRVTQEANCEETGIRTYTCTGCGASYTEEIEATGHHYGTGEVTKEATCEEMGIRTYTCTGCGSSYTEEIPATGHTIVTDKAIPATCITEGKTEGNHCSVCNTVITVQQTIPVTAHKYATAVTKATTESDGSITKKCAVCGAVKSTTAIPHPQTIELSKTIYTYNGKNQQPSVTVKDSQGKALAEGTDYSVSYSGNCKDVGKYTVTINFTGNYSGSVEKSFTITPKSTSLAKVKAAKKGFTAKWKKQSSQTTGYQIQYSTSSKFTKKVTKAITISKNKTTSKSISKLKAKKKYYVRIRTYKTVKIDGKNTKIYSDWSKVKTVTTKK